jgi:TIR domain/Pentapeptide repeats (8 copies)
MANPEHLQILKQGVEAWNAWREQNEDIRPDLTDTDLHGVNLTRANLTRADLMGANLMGATLEAANLFLADLMGANLSAAILFHANLFHANLFLADLRGATIDAADLSGANLTHATLRSATLARADLNSANLTRTDLTGAGITGVSLYDTVFGDTNLTAVRGLETCRHGGPSTLDHRTLARSGSLPLAFLRGCGLPDALIDYLPSLLNQPFQFYSCFISYASKDHLFAERLHADLQNKGVRCWFAPEDMKIGDRLRPRIDETIRLYDKLLLVLSKTSVASQWVEQEVETALARERQQGTTILFPVRIDDTVMTLETGWPALIRNTRNIGNFRRWKTHDVYQQAFDRLLRDLKAAKSTLAEDTVP